MPGGRNTRTLYIYETLWEQFTEQAERENRSRSQIIVELIRDYLDKADLEQQPDPHWTDRHW